MDFDSITSIGELATSYAAQIYLAGKHLVKFTGGQFPKEPIRAKLPKARLKFWHPKGPAGLKFFFS
jgi:hypothetical protein